MAKNFTEYCKHNDNLHVFYIGFDLLDNGIGQVKDKFYNEVFDNLPAFAFGESVLKQKISNNGLVPTLREAFNLIYNIPEVKIARDHYINNNVEDKYLKRGEFGELILFHLLKEFFNASSLISKIYFKDSLGLPPHGFDAVHVDVENETIWLGESKLYQDKNRAINELVKDVIGYTHNGKEYKGHFCVDFFNSEFQIITNRLNDSKEKYPEFITKLLDSDTKTLDKLAKINIALFAAFDSSVIKNYNEISFEKELREEVEALYKLADKKLTNHPWHNHMNVFLFLFPLDDKMNFVRDLHLKLQGGQLI
ncbi:DUF1837 domain-containing protein [Macrococcoides canis]|uniref:HamA C-terminal domain-containing protein n=1 Tax=Macrococcoides canis TaxID=1855823 RepID=UPI0010FBE5B2|nr:DUF1837 domain-containing protein [Macrococcus canis]QCT75273.1 DUF1837 domain-containing protein [Macrococcus canis]